MGSTSGKIIALLNQKGGVGKTTMAYNMAHAFKEMGKKVLCLDMDPQANLSLLFEHDGQMAAGNIFHLLINSIRELRPLHRPLLLSDVLVSQRGVDLIPAGQELSGFELTVAGINFPRQLILSKFIEKSGLTDEYDILIIDGPPTLGLLVVNILCACHGVVVPFQPDQFSRSGLMNFHDVLENIEEMGLPRVPQVLGYVPNLVDSRRKQVEEDFGEIKEELQERGDFTLFEAIANRVQLVKAQAQKKSVFDFSSKEYSDIKNQFQSMAKHIEEKLHV